MATVVHKHSKKAYQVNEEEKNNILSHPELSKLYEGIAAAEVPEEVQALMSSGTHNSASLTPKSRRPRKNHTTK